MFLLVKLIKTLSVISQIFLCASEVYIILTKLNTREKYNDFSPNDFILIFLNAVTYNRRYIDFLQIVYTY